jgi:hypothetical protein
MAKKHNRPVLHIELNKHEVLQASLEILTWIDDNNVQVLNVAGPRASQDAKIYKGVKEVLEILLILESKRDRSPGSLQLNKAHTYKNIRARGR